jgi:hypothetical protein
MQFLEGSRVGSHPLTKRHLLCDLFGPDGSEAGGSRERPNVWFLYWSIEQRHWIKA